MNLLNPFTFKNESSEEEEQKKLPRYTYTENYIFFVYDA